MCSDDANCENERCVGRLCGRENKRMVYPVGLSMIVRNEEANIRACLESVADLVSEIVIADTDSRDYTADYLLDLVGNRREKNVDTDPTAQLLTGYRSGTAMASGDVDEATAYTFDANDRLLTETKDVAGGTADDRLTEYEYGDSDEKTQQTKKTVKLYTDGSGGTLEVADYTYNLQGRMSKAEIDSDADSNIDTTSEYTYNDSGIRVSVTEKIDGNDDGDLLDQEDSTTTTDYHIDANNPTGYAQVLEEKDDTGDVTKTYTLGHDVIAQQDSTNGVLYLLYDGHGSTRGLVDATGQPLSGQVYRYDAFGIRLDTATALTTLLYSGEQTDPTGLQYLRARYYDPASGRFNRLDPFAGNMSDPQSLHKYLYAHADAVNGIDPSGQILGLMIGGALIGGGIGYYLGGWEGAIWGALAGGGLMATAGMVGVAGGFGALTQLQTIAAIGSFSGFGLMGGAGMYYSMLDEWDVHPTSSPKKIAIVTGDLGWKMRGTLMSGFISEYGLASALNWAGHNATVVHKPNEQQFINLSNNNDIVVVLAHGPGAMAIAGDYYDSRGRAFTGMLLGGTSTNQYDSLHQGFSGSPIRGVAPKEWITANELQNQIRNRNLVLAVAGCRVGKSNRLWQAVGGSHFVGSTADISSGGVKSIFQYVVDLVNNGHNAAARRLTSQYSTYAVDPINPRF